MASPVGDSYSTESGGVIAAGIALSLPVTTLVSSGIWCWFSDPEAVYYNGNTYIGWVNSTGSIGVSKFNHATLEVTHATLHASLQVDDHANPTVTIRPDGRLLVCYCAHPDTVMRYRISTNPEDISAWEAAATIAVGSVSYNHTHRLSESGRTYLSYRSGSSGTRPHMRVFSTDDGQTWGSAANWIYAVNDRPYVKTTSNNVDRIDFLFTADHPNEGIAHVYHCYMRVEAGVERFYKSDGTYIGASVTPADCTLIYDASTVNAWVWDIQYGADGHPRVLFVTYPTMNNHQYHFSRWTGTEWTAPVMIVDSGTGLYAGEPYYSGGCCFDSGNLNTVFASVRGATATWEIQEFKTSDNGASWSKSRDLTTGSPKRNCRPVSPKNRNPKLKVLWWKGDYFSYTAYGTSILGAG